MKVVVERHGGEQDRAADDVLPVDRDVEQRERARHHRQQHRAEDGAEDRALAARQAGAADHRRGDDVELHADAEGRLGRAEARHVDDAGDAAERRAEHRGEEDHPLGADAGIGGRLLVAAGVEDLPERGRAAQQEVEDDDEDHEDDDDERDRRRSSPGR